ncbi:MAG: HEAT repeat domain-containing protein [Planctomycetota bacterium]
MSLRERIVVGFGLGCLAAGLLSGCGFRIEPDPEFMAGRAAPGERSGVTEPEPERVLSEPTAREPDVFTAVQKPRAEPMAVPEPAVLPDGDLARPVVIERLSVMAISELPQVRANAIEGLSRAGVRAESVVALALQDPNPGVRSVAASVVGRSGLIGLAPTLRVMLEDDSAFVRASAIGALHALDADVDPTELSGMLLGAENPRMRSHAAFILGEMGDQSAVPMLKQAWATPISNATEIERRLVRLQIAEALVKLGEQESIDAVRAALYPARPEELEATALAVQIIGQVRDRGSIDQLIYMSEAADGRVMPAEVRLAVAEALARMGMTEGGFLADEYRAHENDAIRAQAAVVYGRTGRSEHLPRLEELMRDSSELVRVAAASGVLDLLSGGATAGATAP